MFLFTVKVFFLWRYRGAFDDNTEMIPMADSEVFLVGDGAVFNIT